MEADSHLCVDVVWQHSKETWLYWERLVKELLVEILLGVMDEHHCDGRAVKLRSSCAAHHLQDVRDGHVHVATRLAVIELGALDHHEVGGEVDTPRQGGRGNKHLRREEKDVWRRIQQI